MADIQLLQELELFIAQNWRPEPARSGFATSEIPAAKSAARPVPEEPVYGAAPSAQRPEKLPGMAKKKRGFLPVLPSISRPRKSEAKASEVEQEQALQAGQVKAPQVDRTSAPKSGNAVFPEFFNLDEAPAGKTVYSLEPTASLDERLKYLDESFAQMLLRKIDEAGIKDSDCYNRAHLNRALFNKIKNDPGYRTSKETVIALGLALNLKRPEFCELLTKAGFALSPSSKFDVIIDFCLHNKIYDIMEVNELLFTHDQTLLGAK